MNKSTAKTFNFIMAISLILLNIYFIPLSFELSSHQYDVFGLSVILLMSLVVNLSLILSLLTFFTRLQHKPILLVMNSLALVWALICLAFFNL